MSIKKREIIGNYFGHKDYAGKVFLVTDIHKSDHYGHDDQFEINAICVNTPQHHVFKQKGFDCLIPIEITEEWANELNLFLELESPVNGLRQVLEYDPITQTLPGWYYVLAHEYDDTDGSSNYTQIKVDYIHQAQNIHFYITGQEVLIKNQND